jgi:NitT/TauT family transport system permease protein
LALHAATRPFGLAEYPLRGNPRRRRLGDVVFWVAVVTVAAVVVVLGLLYLNSHLGFDHFPRLIAMGFATFARVVALLVISTLIWVPVGVKIGMSPKLSRYAQPVVQVLASFPAILLFPFATLIFIHLDIPLD